MSPKLMRRFVGVVSSALLALMLVGPQAATAAQAGWAFTDATYLPSAVTPGSYAGYRFTIVNGGNSNISQLYLLTSVNQPAAYLAGDRADLCQTSPTLTCSFGALNAGDHITLTVAYLTPSSGKSFPVNFMINSTGATSSDKGKNSHGDTLSLSFSTTLSANQDFAGGFNLSTGSFTVANSRTLGRQNVQSTAATVSQSDIPVTVQDGSGVSSDCLNCTKTLIGEWSVIEVNEGNAVSGGIDVTLELYWKSVPNKLDPSTLVVYHTYTQNGVEMTDALSSSTDCAAVGCITSAAFDSSKNLVVGVHLPFNGYIRGAF